MFPWRPVFLMHNNELESFMVKGQHHPDERPRILNRSSVMMWAIPIVFSVALNLGLFGLMPGLIQTIPDRPHLGEAAPSIQVIRIKRPESPLKKKEMKKPPEPERKKLRPIKEKPLQLSKPLMKKISLPFQLNPKLPEVSQTFAVPAMENLTLSPLEFKESYASHEIDAPLTSLSKMPPIYPLKAKRRGIQGFVKVKFVVNKDGRVENITVIEAQPSDIFNKSVYQCVSKWRFKPGTVEGIAVNTWAETTIRFKLEN